MSDINDLKPKWYQWILLPWFILQAFVECFTGPRVVIDPDVDIAAQLSPEKRKIWWSLKPEERAAYHEALKDVRFGKEMEDSGDPCAVAFGRRTQELAVNKARQKMGR